MSDEAPTVTGNQGIPNGEEPEPIEGLDDDHGTWGDYPLDELLIRQDNRAVQDVLRRIKRGSYVMNPDFQRDFIWPEDKQSKLIESVIMRIPLPVFYMAEDRQGRVIVVDGLQRLSTFQNFVNGGLKLRLPERGELNGKTFTDLPPKYQNRVEDCNLLFYIIDAKAPEQARLDIFERVNGGVPLTRQQMRNCLFMGPATTFLKTEAQKPMFRKATGSSLNEKTMRDREFVNRFCAFRVIGIDGYRGDMDKFLADCLNRMNQMTDFELKQLSKEFRRGLTNNFKLFGHHAFRKSFIARERRSVINASLWDVMSTGLCQYTESHVTLHSDDIELGLWGLLEDENYIKSISYATNDTERVRHRLTETKAVLEGILGVPEN